MRRSLSHRQQGNLISWRIRAFVAVMGFRYFGVGQTIHKNDELYQQSLLFKYVFDIAPPTTWAVIFALMGIACTVLVIRPRVVAIRALLVVSVGLTSVWAAGFALVQFKDDLPVSLATVFFVALTLKDLIVSAMPFVTSEGVVKQNVIEHDGDVMRKHYRDLHLQHAKGESRDYFEAETLDEEPPIAL